MLTKHPSNIKVNVGKKDEIDNVETSTTDRDMSTVTFLTAEEEAAAITTERVKTAAKLEGITPENVLSRNKKASVNNNISTNTSGNNTDRLSKESGIGSSVSSSLDEKDDEIDNSPSELFTSFQSNTNTFTSESTKISPRVSQLLDELDDTMTKLTNDNKKSLDVNSEIPESNCMFNDTESSTSGGTNNEPDSPSLISNFNNSTTTEFVKRKHSFKRKNSSRSIFSVLSSGSLRSSSSSRNSRGGSGSLSDPDDELSNHNHRVTIAGSTSKAERILSRSGFSSLSIRRRHSKSTMSVALPDKNNMISPRLSSSPESLSKAVYGFRPSSSSSEEKVVLPTLNNARTNKITGYDDDNIPILDRSSKASKLLGLNDGELRRATSMCLVSEFKGDNVKSNIGGGNIGCPLTVASIRESIITYRGILSKYTNTSFKLSKSWKRRYFILSKSILYCFKSSERTSLLLDQFEFNADSVVCVSEAFNGKSWVLQVGKPHQKPWFIQADNVEDMKCWLTELKSIAVNLFGSSQLSTPKPSFLINQTSRSFMTSLPPPPRPKSAPSLASCPPSPTVSFISPISSHSRHNVPSDVEELSNSSINHDYYSEIHPRPSSPVETLSPPRARLGNEAKLSNHQHKGSTSSTYSINNISPSGHRKRSGSFDGSLSVNISLVQKQQQQSSVNYSPKRSSRNSSLDSHRESIPIMMPSWGVRTASPTSMLNPYVNITSLPPPPRSTRTPPSNDQTIPSKSVKLSHLPNPPKLPEGPKPVRNSDRVSSIDPDLRTTRSPPPNIPLPQPPPRPINTITPVSRATSPIPSYKNNKHVIPPPPSTHLILSLIPPPVPPPRRPGADKRIGGKGISSGAENLPSENVNTVTSSSQGRPSPHGRTMTLPVNLPSNPKLPARSKSPPPSRNHSSMVYSSNPSRFKTMSIHLPYITLPPPTRPPNVPLPPIPNQTPSSSSTSKITSSSIRSQMMKSTSGISNSNTTYLSVISGLNNNNLLGNNLQQLSGSGLTFVMIEETLGDGEKVLDLQDVSENHPHMIKSRSSSYSNLHNDFIRHDKEAKNKNISRKNSLANIMEFEGKGKGMVRSNSVEANAINVIFKEKVDYENNNINITSPLSSMT
ncbi:15390_t:CDS:2 [Funneliformis geosporum]|uniref:15390_t:CDS:1 n=1 Tax=Funneliformis geosporum TaxID=1117311 RepID=A0A9W4SPK9_9GLOM|nr:15390_t:CDS:2 [Funneliformis geosporum]